MQETNIKDLRINYMSPEQYAAAAKSDNELYVVPDTTGELADKITLDAVKAKTDLIGTASDTGGSTTAGTVMGKLNKAIANTDNITVDLSGVNSDLSKPLDGLLKDMSHTAQVGSDTSKQVLISSIVQKANSGGRQMQVGSFTAQTGGQVRLTATLYGYSSSAVSMLAINTTDGLSLLQGNMKTDAGTAAYVTVTGNASKTVSVDFEAVSGKTYYLYLGSSGAGGTAYAYCSSAYLGWEDKRLANTFSVKSVQRGSITLTSSDMNRTVNIVRVNPQKSFVLHHVRGSSNYSSGPIPAGKMPRVVLDALGGALHVATANAQTNDIYIEYQVIEFF